ncbi:S41A family C-terminal processing peptidase-3 [Anseongella ginsenosidimutans]|uniref:S41A family C-terminal processing peptidase-3 n=2 Tax=Anseongella ginsenosidimutans TaxID=496056 RepID=A0A4V2UTM5_9SPHI|nr:S41 family peptidase [Anseongella ginsenosidimutans]TCS86782.1 S41A family C-terminal processing peptidase-3 [Anseongella ginsenosidimutans]
MYNLRLAMAGALIMVLGMYFGSKMNDNSGLRSAFDFPFNFRKSDKLEEIMELIEERYVDSIDFARLERNALEEILKHLDPHSSYIPASEFKRMNAKLKGRFDGIGVEFRMMNDTVLAVTVERDGPAEQAGIRPGDKIITVDGTTVSGEGMTNGSIVNLIRGPEGTSVRLEVKRYKTPDILEFDVKRGKIPINSVEVSFMLNEETGYIKVNRFAASTHSEFVLAAGELKDLGMINMVLDLRNNGGGYLSQAIALADEFLTRRQLIVYTEGYNYPKEEYFATSNGLFEEGKLVVLINEGTASASEVLSGALQDLDRATLIGRRSFGKGLVQRQTTFPDGSALRLTIARYYTPLGRSIQKPYSQGTDVYFQELSRRLERGELYSLDSMEAAFPDSLKVVTAAGKVLYGGGGILPDIFVPVDTVGVTAFYRELYANDVVYDFTYRYIDRQMASLSAYESLDDFAASFSLADSSFARLVSLAAEEEVRAPEPEVSASEALLKNQVKALIARRFWGYAGFYKVTLTRDEAINQALQVISE